MNKLFADFLHKFTFRRQLEIVVAPGIFLLVLFSSVLGSWQGNQRVRGNLIEQARHVTGNPARHFIFRFLHRLYLAKRRDREAVDGAVLPL